VRYSYYLFPRIAAPNSGVIGIDLRQPTRTTATVCFNFVVVTSIVRAQCGQTIRNVDSSFMAQCYLGVPIGKQKSPLKRALVRALESVRPTSRYCYSK
jgi:hypothetical protein